MMNRFTDVQRIQIVKMFYGNNESYRSTFRTLRKVYGRHNRPTESAIRRIIEKFESTGNVYDVKHQTRMKRQRSDQKLMRRTKTCVIIRSYR